MQLTLFWALRAAARRRTLGSGYRTLRMLNAISSRYSSSPLLSTPRTFMHCLYHSIGNTIHRGIVLPAEHTLNYCYYFE